MAAARRAAARRTAGRFPVAAARRAAARRTAGRFPVAAARRAAVARRTVGDARIGVAALRWRASWDRERLSVAFPEALGGGARGPPSKGRTRKGVPAGPRPMSERLRPSLSLARSPVISRMPPSTTAPTTRSRRSSETAIPAASFARRQSSSRSKPIWESLPRFNSLGDRSKLQGLAEHSGGASTGSIRCYSEAISRTQIRPALPGVDWKAKGPRRKQT